MSEAQPLVLIVEDEGAMRTFARIALASHGYRSVEASTAAEGIRQATIYRPDLVLLDLGLPDAECSEVTRRLREWSAVPILIISVRGSEEAKVKALDEGADDYMTKPFGAAEMMARIRAALRNAARSRAGPVGVVHIGEDIRVDLGRRVVTVRGADAHLSPIEYSLLATLVRHAGMVLTHRHLLEEVWGPGHEKEIQYLRVYMTHLRHKLERKPARPKYLMTEPGIGYRLRVEC
jgi:two-component system KDP operon response regulator KdpE